MYTLNSLSGLKGLRKFIPRDSFNSSLYILFSMCLKYRCKSDIAIFAGRVTWNHAYSPFIQNYSGILCLPHGAYQTVGAPFPKGAPAYPKGAYWYQLGDTNIPNQTKEYPTDLHSLRLLDRFSFFLKGIFHSPQWQAIIKVQWRRLWI